MKLQGFNVEGPFSADTAFLDNNFDGILAMYHDQALPVIKTLDFSTTVNVTFGLPFLRTSVDHGTAYNISNKLIANPESMVEALKIAGYGKKFKKSLGQNFLRDGVVLDKISSSISLSNCKKIIEIGPGDGALTRNLLANNLPVTVIEYDKDLIPKLESEFSQFHNFSILNEDILS